MQNEVVRNIRELSSPLRKHLKGGVPCIVSAAEHHRHHTPAQKTSVSFLHINALLRGLARRYKDLLMRVARVQKTNLVETLDHDLHGSTSKRGS